jgi:hypothetical protein
MLDEPLNTTIDEVARQMTDGTPGDSVAFRRRVIARIEAGSTPRAPRRPLFVIVALAAAIVIAIMVTRSGGPKGPALQPSRPIANRSAGPGGMAGPGAQTPQPLRAADAALQMTARAAPNPAVSGPRASGPGVVKTTPALEPNAVASIAVAPLAVDTLTPESIRIEQLETIAPVLVAPLDITDVPRRNE